MTRLRSRLGSDDGDDGAAAVEMALVSVLLLAIFGLVAPLGVIYYESVQLGRNTADVVRFASSRPSLNRTVVDPSGVVRTIAGGALPSDDQVRWEAARAVTGTDRLLQTSIQRVRPGPTQAADAICPSGRRVTVTLSNEVDLGVFSAFIPIKVKKLSATATSCEE